VRKKGRLFLGRLESSVEKPRGGREDVKSGGGRTLSQPITRRFWKRRGTLKEGGEIGWEEVPARK